MEIDSKLQKSLTDLIDETLLELEELKKSRFSAAEIEIKGPGAESLAGKPVNGKLDAAKGEDEESEDEDEAEKSEETAKAEDKKDDKDEPHKDDPDHEQKEKDMAKKLLEMHKEEDAKKSEEIAGLKKSLGDMESLMKSYVDQMVAPLQSQLGTILEAVNKLANSPMPARGVSYRNVTPLQKSSESEPLSKSQVANKLFELKKSGARVDSADIARAEMGHGLEDIVTKYGIN